MSDVCPECYKKWYRFSNKCVNSEEHKRKNQERKESHKRTYYSYSSDKAHARYASKEKEDERRKRKYLVLSHYSSAVVPICDCCGEMHLEFLTIEHANGDGKAQRKELGHGGGDPFYRWLINHELPDDLGLEVLCMNCNWAKANFGSCPHKK